MCHGCVTMCVPEAWSLCRVKFLSGWREYCQFPTASRIARSFLSHVVYRVSALSIILLQKALTVDSPSFPFCDSTAPTVYQLASECSTYLPPSAGSTSTGVLQMASLTVSKTASAGQFQTDCTLPTSLNRGSLQRLPMFTFVLSLHI